MKLLFLLLVGVGVIILTTAIIVLVYGLFWPNVVALCLLGAGVCLGKMLTEVNRGEYV